MTKPHTTPTLDRPRAKRAIVSEQSRPRPQLVVGLVLALLLSTTVSHGWADEPSERFEYQQVHMGVDFTLIFYAPDQAAANQASKAAFQRIADLNAKLSDYDPESELSKLSQSSGSGTEVTVSDDLWRVLVSGEQLSARTEGAFDVTVGPLVRLWRRARRQHELPSQQRIAEALDGVGHQHIRFQPEEQAVMLARPGMRLDLGAIAKGYATDEALLVLREAGCPRAMIDGSGDLALGDPPPNTKGWKIAIAGRSESSRQPTVSLTLANCGVATSGDVYQFVQIDGRRYSHIVDPQTGLGLTTPSTVTVVAPTGIMADSLASAVSVLGPEAGLQLIEATDDCETLIIVQEGDALQRYESRGMTELLQPQR